MRATLKGKNKDPTDSVTVWDVSRLHNCDTARPEGFGPLELLTMEDKGSVGWPYRASDAKVNL